MSKPYREAEYMEFLHEQVHTFIHKCHGSDKTDEWVLHVEIDNIDTRSYVYDSFMDFIDSLDI